MNRRGFFVAIAGAVVPFVFGVLPERARRRVFEKQIRRAFEAGSDSKIVMPKTKPHIDEMHRRMRM